MTRPLIAVTGSARGGRLMWWFSWLAIRRAGGKPVRVTAERPADIAAFDGLLIGGGDDIGPELYKGEVVPGAKIDPDRDALEIAAVRSARGRGMPVLGICRGAQMLNIALGGTLHQDIHAVFEGVARGRSILPRKRISVAHDSRLHAILGDPDRRVNAIHHQSVDRPGKGLAIVAHDSHGIVQAVEDPAHPFTVGVQWHPEWMPFDRAQQRLFRALVDASRKMQD